MARRRDYKAEYERRLARAAAKGLSRSQARGHARAGEAPIRTRKPIKGEDRLEAALKALRRTGKQGDAAKEAGVSPERLRRFLRENALAERRGRRWQITDQRLRHMRVLTAGQSKMLRISGFDQASVVGSHLAAVRRFLETNDIAELEPFKGRSVKDAAGKSHPLETDPNSLYRLAAAGGEGFEQVYRLIQ
ncbi:MAG TPA: hypothetical protein VH331_14095 [Allosphingosinicella sp.]|jgi:hypothetical protein|nr:hypothetical protein [Allosphingosinicella sp.]